MKCKMRYTFYFLSMSCFLVNAMQMSDLFIVLAFKINRPHQMSPKCTNSTNEKTEQQLEWSPLRELIVMSSIFYTYVFTILIADVLIQRFTMKCVIAGSQLAISFIKLIYADLTNQSYYYAVILRAFEGFFSALIFKAIILLTKIWLPKQEKFALISQAEGSSLGIAITYLFYALILAKFHWRYCLICTGLVGIVWTIAWIILGANSPSECPRVSPEERAYIETYTEKVNFSLPVPWLHILLSKSVWATAGIYFSWSFFRTFIHFYLPTYFIYRYGLPTFKVGGYSALPFFSAFVTNVLLSIFSSGYLSDKHLKWQRKFWSLISTVGATGPLLILVLFRCKFNLTIPCIVLSACLTTTAFLGFMNTPSDLSPIYASYIETFCQFLSLQSCHLVPLTVYMFNFYWAHIWECAIILNAVLCIPYLIFGEAGVQPWNFYGVYSETVMEDRTLQKVKEKQELQHKKLIKPKKRKYNRTFDEANTSNSKK